MSYNKFNTEDRRYDMCPNDILPGIDLYVIFLGLGVVAAIIAFSKLSDLLMLEAKVHNFTLYTAIAAVVLGYGSAVLFQAFYNMADEGEFVINQGTGATFYGGLIGGAAAFFAIYFIAGHFVFKDKLHVRRVFAVTDGAAASIVIAHSLGRIGCLMAGCCHGKVTDAWYGIYMPALRAKVVPIQLFEALFLLALFFYFVYRIRNKKTYNIAIYMIAYGAWRFVIEYFRTDDRGETFVPFLTPSQLTAVFMIIGAVILIFIMKYFMSKVSEAQGQEVVENEVQDEQK